MARARGLPTPPLRPSRKDSSQSHPRPLDELGRWTVGMPKRAELLRGAQDSSPENSCYPAGVSGPQQPRTRHPDRLGQKNQPQVQVAHTLHVCVLNDTFWPQSGADWVSWVPEQGKL